MTFNIIKKIFKHNKDESDGTKCLASSPTKQLRDKLNKLKDGNDNSDDNDNGIDIGNGIGKERTLIDTDLLAALSYTEGVRALKMPSGFVPHPDCFVEVPVRFAILAIELLHRGSY